MEKTFNLLDGAALAASGFATSDPTDVYGAVSVTLTMSKTGDSTLVDFVVYASPDGVAIDTEPLQTFEIAGAGAKQLTRPVAWGAGYIVVKALNLDGVNAGTATAKLTPVYGSCIYR